ELQVGLVLALQERADNVVGHERRSAHGIRLPALRELDRYRGRSSSAAAATSKRAVSFRSTPRSACAISSSESTNSAFLRPHSVRRSRVIDFGCLLAEVAFFGWRLDMASMPLAFHFGGAPDSFVRAPR